jgi:hypothetical protein
MIDGKGDVIAHETWTLLYGQAEKLRQMQPWKLLYDADLFGIMDAESGQIVWFSVMGALGEVFSLGVYVGEDGLDYFLKIANAEWAENPPDQIVLGMNYMSVEFVIKSALTRQDKETIKTAAFTPPARGRVAQFRSMHKGFGPWYLDADETALLARVIPAVVEIIGGLMEDPRIFEKSRKVGMPPYYTKGKNGELQLQWYNLSEDMEVALYSSFEFSEFEAAEIKKSATQSTSEWTIGFAMLGGMIAENDKRPYPAGAFLCLDIEAEMVFTPVMYQPGISQGTLAAQVLLAAIHDSGQIPATVVSEEAEWLDGMMTIAEALGIELYEGDTPVILKFGALMSHVI